MKKPSGITKSKSKKIKAGFEALDESPPVNSSISDVEILLGGLHLLGAILAPLDEAIGQLKAEFTDFMVDPFDMKKRVSISEQRVLYEQFGNNPLHAWQAIQIWHESNLQQSPQWAFCILAKSAKKITAAGATDARINSSIKNGLGINGNKFKQFKKNMFWLEVFHEVEGLVSKGIAQTAAFLQVAEKHHGKAGAWRTVEKRYFDYRAKLVDVAFPHPFDP